jgi:Predicted S-adenosylmethionine-dependent methyltransferase involved in cell envelope biogenesis
MNPKRGQPASALLERVSEEKLGRLLLENSDERNPALPPSLAGKTFSTTRELATAVRDALRALREPERELSVRRVFQALRIAVNDEFSALDTFPAQSPSLP